jgi:hypothetical protein
MLVVQFRVMREVILVCLQGHGLVPVLGPLYHQTLIQWHTVSARKAPWLSAPLVGHFLTLILYAQGVSEFLSRMHLWIFAM